MLDTATLYTHFERCTGITTDSRRVSPGDLYVALRGERFDGNQYAEAALVPATPWSTRWRRCATGATCSWTTG